MPFKAGSVIHVTPMIDGDYQDNQYVFFDTGDRAIIPEAIAPVAGTIAHHSLATQFRVVERSDLFEANDDPGGGTFI